MPVYTCNHALCTHSSCHLRAKQPVKSHYPRSRTDPWCDGPGCRHWLPKTQMPGSIEQTSHSNQTTGIPSAIYAFYLGKARCPLRALVARTFSTLPRDSRAVSRSAKLTLLGCAAELPPDRPKHRSSRRRRQRRRPRALWLAGWGLSEQQAAAKRYQQHNVGAGMVPLGACGVAIGGQGGSAQHSIFVAGHATGASADGLLQRSSLLSCCTLSA